MRRLRPATKSEPMPAVVRGLLNIRLVSSLALGTGWATAFILALTRLYDRADRWDGTTCCDPLEEVGLVWVGLAIAVVYALATAVIGWMRTTTLTSSFVLTAIHGPMTMLSFVFAFDHTFDSQLADLACVTSGVLNIVVIATSWMATNKMPSRLADSHPLSSHPLSSQPATSDLTPPDPAPTKTWRS